MSTDVVTVFRHYNGGWYFRLPIDERVILSNLLDIEGLDPHIREALVKSKTVPGLRDSITQEANGLRTQEESNERDEALAILEDVQSQISAILGPSPDVNNACISLIKQRLPVFFYFSDYSALPGRIDLRELANDPESKPGSSALQTARQLLVLAETDIPSLRCHLKPAR